MAIPFESVGEIDVIGDIYCSSQPNNSVTDNIIGQNDSPMHLGSTQYLQTQQGPNYGHVTQTLLDNGIHYGSGTANTYHEPFLLTNSNMDSSFDFEFDETMIFGDNAFEPERVSPRLLLPKNIIVPTERMQPQSKINITRRKTARNQIGRKYTSSSEEENSFIHGLRAKNTPWKRVSELFFQRFGKTMTNASLQMRMLRRRKRTGNWIYPDTKLLHEVYEYWETKKYTIIATKLQELGASQVYTEQQVELQLQHSRHE